MNRDDPAWIAQEYKRRQSAATLYRLALIPLTAGLVLSGSKAMAHGGPGMTFLAVLLLAGLIFVLWRMVVTWRCPACNKDLGRDFSTTYCPRCGVRLEL